MVNRCRCWLHSFSRYTDRSWPQHTLQAVAHQNMLQQQFPVHKWIFPIIGTLSSYPYICCPEGLPWRFRSEVCFGCLGLKIKALWSFKALDTTYWLTWCYMPEDLKSVAALLWQPPISHEPPVFHKFHILWFQIFDGWSFIFG